MATKKFSITRATPAALSPETITRTAAVPTAPKVKDPSSALAAVLTMTFAHTAEVFEVFATAVSEHYGIDREEMFGVIKAHPSWEAIRLHPALKDLGYLPAAEAVPAEAVAVPSTTAVPAEPTAPAALNPKKKKFIIRSPPGSVA